MPILLSLHGTGVDPGNQADSYKYMIGKSTPYRFGVSHLYVLSPDRFGAHDWEYTGYWSAMKATDALTELSRKLLKVKFNLPEADRQHILYTGHSV